MRERTYRPARRGARTRSRPGSILTSRVEVAPYTVALATVAGAWLGHSLEYLRVWGWSNFGSTTSRQIHIYMGPVGVILVLFALIGVEAGLRSFRRFERVLSGLEDGTVHPKVVTRSRRRFGLPVTSLLCLVWLLQMLLYVVQENAELRAVGLHQPFWSVLTGAHLMATGVHLVVAATLVLALWLLHRPLAVLAEAVREVVAWLAAMRRRVVARAPRITVVRSWTPAERFGRHLWSRPPPSAPAY